MYMQDDKRGMYYANIFSQKEFENLFLLSGGIEKFIEEYPDLLEGKNIPQVKISAHPAKNDNSKQIASKSSTSKRSKSPKSGFKSYNI